MIKKTSPTLCRRAGRRPYWLADPQQSTSPPPDPADPQTRQSSGIASQSQPLDTETHHTLPIYEIFTFLIAVSRSRNDLISALAPWHFSFLFWLYYWYSCGPLLLLLIF